MPPPAPFLPDEPQRIARFDMKLAYLSASTIPSRSANSIHVMKMCQAFGQLGMMTRLYVPDMPADELAAGEDCHSRYGVARVFEIERVWWSKLFGRQYVSGFLAAQKAVRDGAQFALARCIPSACFAARAGLPVVFEYHQPISDSGRLTRLNELLFDGLITAPGFRGLVVITHALKAHFLERYPQLEERIFVAPDGADPFPADVTPVDLPAGEERLQVGYVGHLFAGKGMEVVAQLCRQAPFADFHVVGGLERDIEQWQAELGDQPNVRFHGFVPHARTAAYIAAFDVVLLPNQNRITWHKAGGDIGRWTSPLKMFEYMSAGKPIISSDLPVLREVLDDGRNALLCAPDDIQAWLRALEQLDDRGLRERLGQQALADFSAQYSWQRRAEAILRRFNENA
jgi:glycosyltransferase involved in cell wall biosynthesis